MLNKLKSMSLGEKGDFDIIFNIIYFQYRFFH